MHATKRPEAQRTSHAYSPTGLRRLTPNQIKADRMAEDFDGLPPNVTHLGQLLAAFKAAAPWLGFPPRLVHAIDWLFKFTRLQDWGKGTRPIVWPSASMQQEALGLSATQTKALNRALIEAGLIAMKDSPNGKRYGRRDGKGQIIEAYGFDLSPLAMRYAEFTRMAEEARAERGEMGCLRRRATIARKGIQQLLETAAEYGLVGEEWTRLAGQTRTLAAALRRVETLGELAMRVEGLERRQREAYERLQVLLSKATAEHPDTMDSDPLGPENRPHQYNYKPAENPNTDTVTARDEGKPPAAAAAPSPATPEPQGGLQRSAKPTRFDNPGLKLSSEELVRLAPGLRPYLRSATPDWREIVDAGDRLRHHLGVSKSLWGEACVTMGREPAAIALAIVSAKPEGHFTSSPGGYFFGMVAKAKAGQLNLERTIWGLRKRQQRAGEACAPRRAK